MYVKNLHVLITMGICFSIVDQGSLGLVETCGKFSREENPGCVCLIPCVQQVAHIIDMRQQQLLVVVDTKTHDDVFCKVKVAIIYSIKRNQVQTYIYGINGPLRMIDSSVQNIVRSILCTYKLNDAFVQKVAMSNEIQNQLVTEFGIYGIAFSSVLINDIEPDPKVRSAMNEKQAQERLREAQMAAAEAEKFTMIAKAEAESIASLKRAEADADVKILNGKGVAGQRRELAIGFSQSIDEIKKTNSELDAGTITDLIQSLLYMDTVKAIGSSSKSNLVFLPSPSPSSSSTDMRNNAITSSLINKID